ncbi:MAG: hypothetical protein V3U89_04860 [Methylophilaceae bacterium]
MKGIGLLVLACLLNACASFSTEPNAMPQRNGSSSINQLVKTDFDRMADVELAENTQSLRTLMTKLYKRNPRELEKSGADSVEQMVEWVFEGEAKHHWRFKHIEKKQGTDAIFLAFDQQYLGDRVLPFIVGLQTMLAKAHNHQKEFFLTDQSLDPQRLYNVARNIEIAVWKLSNSRDANGNLYLLTNEINETAHNLSFERAFGKMIGRTDLYAFALAEKSQRLISRVMQNLATAVFLPF